VRSHRCKPSLRRQAADETSKRITFPRNFPVNRAEQQATASSPAARKQEQDGHLLSTSSESLEQRTTPSEPKPASRTARQLQDPSRNPPRGRKLTSPRAESGRAGWLAAQRRAEHPQAQAKPHRIGVMKSERSAQGILHGLKAVKPSPRNSPTKIKASRICRHVIPPSNRTQKQQDEETRSAEPATQPWNSWKMWGPQPTASSPSRSQSQGKRYRTKPAGKGGRSPGRFCPEQNQTTHDRGTVPVRLQGHSSKGYNTPYRREQPTTP
jgi:hypothetical protein